MPDYPKLTDAFRIARLTPRPGRLRMVLDTDTYNEIDDQFAVAQVLGAPERLSVEALYAAPFHNDRSTGPGEGMEKSYDEIQRLLKLIKLPQKPPVFRGATAYLTAEAPQRTEVTDDLVRRAMSMPDDEPLYVVAIGAITNVAAAILLEPRIIQKIVVLWLGGHALHLPDTAEFNLKQDVPAARVVLDSGVPLVLFPCNGMVDRLLTTNQELQACLYGRSKLGDYLVDIVRDYNKERRPIWSKVIWDIAPAAWLIKPEQFVCTVLTHSPLLSDRCNWSHDQRRHLIRVGTHLQRDRIFEDVFDRIASL